MRHGAEERPADLLLAGAPEAHEAEQLALSISNDDRARGGVTRSTTRARTGPARSCAFRNSSRLERPTMRLTSSAGVVSATGFSPTLSPSRITTTRSAMRKISSRRCDT